MAEQTPKKITVNRVVRFFPRDPVLLGYKPMTLWVDGIYRYQRNIDAGAAEDSQAEIYIWQDDELKFCTFPIVLIHWVAQIGDPHWRFIYSQLFFTIFIKN